MRLYSMKLDDETPLDASRVNIDYDKFMKILDDPKVNILNFWNPRSINYLKWKEENISHIVSITLERNYSGTLHIFKYKDNKWFETTLVHTTMDTFDNIKNGIRNLEAYTYKEEMCDAYNIAQTVLSSDKFCFIYSNNFESYNLLHDYGINVEGLYAFNSNDDHEIRDKMLRRITGCISGNLIYTVKDKLHNLIAINENFYSNNTTNTKSYDEYLNEQFSIAKVLYLALEFGIIEELSIPLNSENRSHYLFSS